MTCSKPRPRKLLLLPALLLLAGLACNLSPVSTPTPARDTGWIETAAAATEAASMPDATLPVASPAATLPAATLPAATLPAADPSPTGTAEPLPAVTTTPAPPAVLRVAYVKDGAVWLWTEGGAPQQLTAGEQRISQVNLSPDGQLVAFVRLTGDETSELGVVAADGTGEQVLVDAEALHALDPSAFSVSLFQFDWIPGAHSLAFNTRQVFQGPGLVLYDDLRVVDASTGALSTRLPPGQGGTFYFSPDGSRIALVTPTQIHLAQADGSGRVEALSYPSVITYSEYHYYPVPTWSPDGQFLRVAIPPADPLAETLEPTTLWRITTDGSVPPALTGSIQTVPFMPQPAHFSPDHTRLAYVVPRGDPALNLRELHLALADGSGDSVFANRPNLTFLGWSEDPQWFAFTTEDEQNTHVGRLTGEVFTLPKTSGQWIQNLQWVGPDRVLYGLGDNTSGVWSVMLARLGEAGILTIDTGLDEGYIFDWSR